MPWSCCWFSDAFPSTHFMMISERNEHRFMADEASALFFVVFSQTSYISLNVCAICPTTGMVCMILFARLANMEKAAFAADAGGTITLRFMGRTRRAGLTTYVQGRGKISIRTGKYRLQNNGEGQSKSRMGSESWRVDAQVHWAQSPIPNPQCPIIAPGSRQQRIINKLLLYYYYYYC